LREHVWIENTCGRRDTSMDRKVEVRSLIDERSFNAGVKYAILNALPPAR
jgi:hypothetical protein